MQNIHLIIYKERILKQKHFKIEEKKMEEAEVKVMVADESHIKYIDTILTTIAEAAKKRGSGIAKRSPEYVATKMREAKAVIALQGEKFAGFSYIETWGNKHYVTTSGLIVHPDFRGLGLAKRIKNLTFTLADSDGLMPRFSL